MTATGGETPRRQAVTAEVVIHSGALAAVSLSLAAYAASGGNLGAGRLMAVVLAGLGASGVTEFVGGLRRDAKSGSAPSARPDFGHNTPQRAATESRHAMNVEFFGLGHAELHREAVFIEGAVDGRPVHFRFTRDAIRSVAPSVTDGRDLITRLKSQADVFSSVVARKLRAAAGETPDELTITEADVLSVAAGLAGQHCWSDDGGRVQLPVNDYA